MAKKLFMSLLPRDRIYNDRVLMGIPLRVIMKDGVKLDPDIKISATKLSGQKSLYRNESGPNYTFQVTVLLNNNDTVSAARDKGMLTNWTRDETIDITSELYWAGNQGKSNPRTIDLLDWMIRNSKPLYVITEQKERKHTHDTVMMEDAQGNLVESGYVQWDLTFTRITPYTPSVFKNTNSVVKKAVAKSQTKDIQKKVEKTVAKTAAALTTAVTKTANKDKLKKCDPKKIYYSKNRRVTDCTRYMQEILHNKGHLKGNKSDVVDGWYGDKTLDAVKAFKKKYAKKYNLQVNGTIGDKTIKALTTE